MSVGGQVGTGVEYVELTRRLWDRFEANQAFALHKRVVAWLGKWRPEVAVAVDEETDDAVPVPGVPPAPALIEMV